MSKKCLIILLLCSQIKALTLTQAIENSLQSNTDLMEIKQQQQLDQLEIINQRQQLYPSINLKGLAQWNKHHTNTEDASIDLNWTTAHGTNLVAHLQDGHNDSLTLTQPLLKGWNSQLNRAPITKAINKARLTHIKSIELQNHVIKHTFELYLTTLLKHQELDLKKRALNEAKTNYLTGEKRYHKGSLAKLEYLELQHYFLQAKLNFQQGEQSLANAKNNLSLYTHTPIKKTIISKHLKVILPDKLPKNTPPHSKLIHQNLSIRQLNIQLKQASLNLQQAKENKNWDLNFIYKRENSNDQSAGLSLDIPLSTTAKDLAIKSQKLLISQLEHQRANLTNHLKQDLDNAQNNLQQSFTSMNLAELEVQTTKIKHQASKIKFKNGDLPYSKLTEAYDKWLTSLLNQRSLQIEYMLAILVYYEKTNQLHQHWKFIANTSNRP
ncbi:MAG TPA: TolC family protein [Gammaproteobacteria bacterium]|nr:TolC family protein [Gammaproteobacteria bacterium]